MPERFFRRKIDSKVTKECVNAYAITTGYFVHTRYNKGNAILSLFNKFQSYMTNFLIIVRKTLIL